jgi:signal transduction histidine kinase
VARRLLFSYVSLTLLVLIVLEVPLGIAFARAERRQLESAVQHDAFALALRGEEAIEAIQHDGTADPADLTLLSELAHRYDRDQGGRVVYLDHVGRTLADGDPPPLAPGVDAVGRDFSNRPEIERALEGEEVTGERSSTTLGFDILYVAVPIASGGELHGVVRITYPLSFVDARIRENWLILAGVGGVILLLVLALSLVLARSITRPLAELEEGAGALGRGDLDARVAVPSGPRELECLARSFNVTATQLEQLVHSQQAFVADASHQLRTPLAALRLRLENLDRVVTPAGRDDLDGAIEEVARLSLLVDGLLELARAESHGSAPVATSLAMLVTERCDAWRALAEERNVRLVVRGDDEPVLVTPGRLEQVLDNLLNNALEVAPGGSVIEVTVAPGTDHMVELRIADAGPGMTEEQRARAFDRFWRAEGDRSAGFGLGLAIVRQLLVSDGGDVRLGVSAAGGLEVTVRLPGA